MNKDPSSWQCLMRNTVIDTPWFPFFYIFVLIWLFAFKYRFIATLFAIIMICLVIKSISGCMSSIGAFTSIALTHSILIFCSFVTLFILSFINFGNTYVTFAVYFIIIYLLFIYGLFFKIVDSFYPSPVQVISIGGVDVRGKSKEEINALMKKAVVRVND